MQGPTQTIAVGHSYFWGTRWVLEPPGEGQPIEDSYREGSKDRHQTRENGAYEYPKFT